MTIAYNKAKKQRAKQRREYNRIFGEAYKMKSTNRLFITKRNGGQMPTNSVAQTQPIEIIEEN